MPYIVGLPACGLCSRVRGVGVLHVTTTHIMMQWHTSVLSPPPHTHTHSLTIHCAAAAHESGELGIKHITNTNISHNAAWANLSATTPPARAHHPLYCMCSPGREARVLHITSTTISQDAAFVMLHWQTPALHPPPAPPTIHCTSYAHRSG
jgi:hypothetical protein